MLDEQLNLGLHNIVVAILSAMSVDCNLETRKWLKSKYIFAVHAYIGGSPTIVLL